MRLNLTYTDKIDTQLSNANGTATSFTITEAPTLRGFAERAEEQLSEILPKSAWKGARVTCRPAGPSASSYQFGAKSTECTLERGATGWFLIACETVRVYPQELVQMRGLIDGGPNCRRAALCKAPPGGPL